MIRGAITIRMYAHPTRGLRGDIDHSTNDDGSDYGTPQHQPPRDIVPDSAKYDRDDITEGNSKRSPHLPLHDKGTANRGGGAFCSIYRGSCGFGTDPETKKETGDKKLGPGIGKSFPYRGEASDDARPKYTPTTANDPIDWVCKPAR